MALSKKEDVERVNICGHQYILRPEIARFSSLKPRGKAIATPFSEIGHAEMTQIFSESTAQALGRTGSYSSGGSVPVRRR
jgi:hypothetical protein